MVPPATSVPLREEDVDPDPVVQFERWFTEAAQVVEMPDAMALATVAPDGRPSARMVLLKDHGPDGFVFYSNFASRKGSELVANPKAALLFYWGPLGRQIRIEGLVARMSDEESDALFAARTRGAQLAAHASAQSSVVADRASLDDAWREQDARFGGRDVPRPASSGGYRLRAEEFEFWQNRDDRLHDRLRYRRDAGGEWVIERLQP